MSVNKTDSLVINWLRFPMAFLIVLMHTPFLLKTNESCVDFIPASTHSIIAQVIAQIAVPLFFLVSGYLFFQNFTNSNGQVYKQKIFKRVKTLVLPYVVWNLIFFLVPFVIVPLLREGAAALSMQPLAERGYLRIFWDNNLFGASELWRTNILGVEMPKGGMPIDSPLWFIRDLILLSLISPLILWYVRKTSRWGLVLLGVLMVFDIWIPIRFFSISGLFFFALGCWLSIHDFSISDFRLSKSSIKILTYMSLLLLIISSAITIFNIGQPFLQPIAVKLFIVSAVLPIFSIVSTGFKNNKLKTNIILSGSSFFVFALHSGYVMAISSFAVSKVLPPVGLLALLNYLLCALIVTAICVVIYWSIKRFAPWLLVVLSGGR